MVTRISRVIHESSRTNKDLKSDMSHESHEILSS